MSDLTFQVYCVSEAHSLEARRQLYWFQRFLKDQQTKRNGKHQHSSSLFTLRNGRLAWQEGKGKGEPWNIHHLILFCCVDTRLWTAEGTEQVREERADAIAKIITNMKEKGDLNETQQAFVRRKQSTLARINNSFERPSQPLYQGQPHILVGVSLGLDKPATIAVVDATTKHAIAYRSIRQLLGENYKQLNRQRQQKQSLSHQRHKTQKSAAHNLFGESELGQYVDRLLAKEIVAIAQNFQAGSIVVPKLGDMREIIESEIQALAEQKCSGHLESQQKYAKQYRTSVHQWSYGRLIQNIQCQAAIAGIAVEEGQQLIRGSPEEKATGLAIAAYQGRNLLSVETKSEQQSISYAQATNQGWQQPSR